MKTALAYLICGLLIALFCAGLLIKHQNERLQQAAADKAIADRALVEAKGDMVASVAGHNRIVAEKDDLLAALAEQVDAERESAAQYGRIKKDVTNAPKPNKKMVCIESPPVRAALHGLRGLRDSTDRGGLAPDNSVPADRDTGRAAVVPPAAKRAGP